MLVKNIEKAEKKSRYG